MPFSIDIYIDIFLCVWPLHLVIETSIKKYQILTFIEDGQRVLQKRPIVQCG